MNVVNRDLNLSTNGRNVASINVFASQFSASTTVSEQFDYTCIAIYEYKYDARNELFDRESSPTLRRYHGPPGVARVIQLLDGAARRNMDPLVLPELSNC